MYVNLLETNRLQLQVNPYYQPKLVIMLKILGKCIIPIAGLLLMHGFSSFAQYSTPNELLKEFQELSKQHPERVSLHEIAESPGGHTVVVVEIGTEVKQPNKVKPAILVIANPEGINPLSSRASLLLAKQLVSNDKHLAHSWYILPSLNPDAHSRYFDKVKWENPRNALAVNDDMDEAIDEDGPNDLNGDGLITSMRVADPQGEWVADETDPRLMRKANAAKGEKGVYSLYTEGFDADGDGKYNEDPLGGVNTGINFPHLFIPYTPTGGAWPGSTPEVYGVMKYIFSHPEIAATFTFGSTNFCLTPPQGGRKGSVDLDNISIPDNFAEMFGAEKGRKYSMDEIIEMAQPMVPSGVELTPAMVASFLGLGAVVNPLPDDLAWYTELAEQYSEYLKGIGFSSDRLDAERAKDGSFELWSYYHLGVPTFSLNFFTLPKVKADKEEGSGISLDQLEKMSKEEFIALGEEKISAFLAENNAPEQFDAKRLIGMLNSGQFTTKQMAGMMRNTPKPKPAGEVDPKLKALVAYSDGVLSGKGYVNWQPYEHPTLGRVEIGGAAPFAHSTPPAEHADSLISLQLPWIFTLAQKLPNLQIAEHKVKSLGSGVYSIDIWVENKNYLPFPTAMGKRNNQPAPAVLILEADGLEILDGLMRTPITAVDGLKSVKLSYVVRVGKENSIRAKLQSKSAGNDARLIKL
jgi:hypothetical protein